MYGYATTETENLMPAPIFYAHSILKNIMSAVKEAKLGPDAKSQITLAYENNLPVRAESIIVSIQHPENLDQSKVKEIIYPYIVSSLPKGWICPEKNLLVNPTGRFVIGGPVSDCGLTGRKIMVDTYGGYIPHGGGAFSGKDATKVDRSAAYMARYLAKNIVFAGLAERCLVQLSYAIGISQPTSFYIDTFGTNTVDEKRIKKFIEGSIDLSTKGIIRHLLLNRPIYKRTACYGHFGKESENDGGFSWESMNLSADLCREFNMEDKNRTALKF
jgi:S-adenosylmethionine synthetase